MNTSRPWLAAAALLALTLPGVAQGPGSQLPEDLVDLDDFAQTEAKSFEDFTGRAVLLEFFAYW